MIAGQVKDFNKQIRDLCYNNSNKAEVQAKMMEQVEDLANFCKGKMFIAGEALTYVDF